MIKFKGTDGHGGTVLGLGLSRINVALLTEGKPIVVKGADVGLPELSEVLIFFGETERDLMAELRRRGAIGPDTIVHPTPEYTAWQDHRA
jgi:hypothetical protein